MATRRLVVHGGVAIRSDSELDQVRRGAALDAALAEGESCLARGRGAVDAVRAAVACLEASGLFTAGRGSEPQRDGVVRMDASLMNSDGRAGAVIGVSALESAIEGAYLVYDQLEHTTLVGPVADAVLGHLGAATREPSRPTRELGTCVKEHLERPGAMLGTVGAVALDAAGTLAAATSTGGYASAMPGRAGDSGVIGIGTYATPRCAISCTGNGDRFLAAGLAACLDAYLEAGLSPRDAVAMGMRRLRVAGAAGGFLLLLPDGGAWVAANVPVIRVRHTGPIERVNEPRE